MADTGFFPTTEFARRLIAVERDCFTEWVTLLAALPGNPFEAAVRRFDSGGRQITALASANIAHVIFSRVFEMTNADSGQLDSILDFYHEQGVSPMFDLNPYVVEYAPERDGLLDALAARGFYQRSFHQMLYGVPHANTPPTPDHITIRPVQTPDEVDSLAYIYGQIRGIEDQDAIRVLIGQLNYRCFLAFIDGKAAGLGILHIKDGAASMANGMTLPEFRGRGVQTALLYHRMRTAAEAGCTLMVSQCQAGSISQRNQQRVGFQIAGTKVWWVRRE